MQRDFQNCISVPLKSENFVFCILPYGKTFSIEASTILKFKAGKTRIK